MLFDRPGLTLVGWGTALLVPAREAAAALAAIPCDDAVNTLGSGPVALGALPFTDAFGGHVVVPRFTMGTSRDADGVTRRWATAVGPADVALPDTGELFDAVIWQYGTTPAEPTAAGVADLSTAMNSAGYAAMVADAVRAMAQPGATLRKVVLSRPVEVHLDGALSLSAALRRLRAGEPNCTIFSMPVPDGSFFGASPELLVARHGTKVSSHPLAGTVPRGDTARADADAQRDLAGSTKNRAEHRYVVDAIADGPGAVLRGAVGPDRALCGGVSFRGAPRDADRGPAAPARGGAGPAAAAPSHARRGRHAAPRGPGLHRGTRGGRTGPLGRPGGVGRCRG